MSILDGKQLEPSPSRDPVNQHEDGTWWFYEESWTEQYGPYKTEEEAREQLDIYCERYLGA